MRAFTLTRQPHANLSSTSLQLHTNRTPTSHLTSLPTPSCQFCSHIFPSSFVCAGGAAWRRFRRGHFASLDFSALRAHWRPTGWLKIFAAPFSPLWSCPSPFPGSSYEDIPSIHSPSSGQCTGSPWDSPYLRPSIRRCPPSHTLG